MKEDNIFSEVVESSYFDSNDAFVGRHLLFWEKGAYLKMIQYFDPENKRFRPRNIYMIKNYKKQLGL